MPQTQSYTNHTRWNTLHHFIVTPLLLIAFVWAIVLVVIDFEWWRVQILLLTFAVLALSVAARLQALKAQDRVIRLEERLRYLEVLTPELTAAAARLRTGQIIALRFASDEELPGLVQRTLAGEFANPKQIKQAITNWRADHLRV